MVSPFLSFATGALEAVRSKQEADAEAERKRVEREQEIEDLRGMAEFKLKIKQKMKSAEQEFQIPGTSIKVQKGKNSSELYTNVMNAITSVDNQEEVNTMLSDPTQKARFANYTNRMINQSKGQGLFTRPVVKDGVVIKQPIQDFHDFFSNQLSINSKLSNLFRGVEQNTYSQNMNFPKDTVAVTKDASGKPIPVTISSEVRGAPKNYYATLPKMTRNQIYNEARVAKELASKIGGSYNRNAKPYEGLNKFYTAGSNPNIVRYLNSELAGEGDTNRFLNTVRNPKLGFFKANEMGVMEPTADFAKLVLIYSPKNALSSQSQPGVLAIQDRVNFKTDVDLRKDVEAALSSEGLTNGGAATLKEYYSLVQRNPNIASGFARGFTTKLFGIPATIESTVNVISNAFSGDSVRIGDQSFDFNKDRDKKNGAIARTQARLGALSDQIKNGDNVDAARAEVYEISLLYQLAAIYQGGTGGRTISDQDIENMRDLIGGFNIGQKEKLTKLKTAFQHVMRVKTKNSVISMIRNGQNRATAEKLRSMARVLPYFSVAEASQKAEQEIVKKLPITIINKMKFDSAKNHSIGQFMKQFNRSAVEGPHGARVELRRLATQNQVRDYLQQNFNKYTSDNPFKWMVGLNENNVPYIHSMTSGNRTGINLNTGAKVSFTSSGDKITFSDEKKSEKPPASTVPKVRNQPNKSSSETGKRMFNRALGARPVPAVSGGG